MRKLVLYPMMFVLFLAGIVSFPVLVALRPFHRRWGATPDEVRAPMPGDGEVPNAVYQTTRAITVRAPQPAVWPWIAQMGYRRAGWYGFDQFDNDGVPSADHIIPDLQNPRIGEVIGEEGLTIRAVNRDVSLILSFSHPRTVWVFKEGIWPKFGSSSLAYVLFPVDENQTRLIVRMRFGMRIFSLPTLWWPFFEIGDFLNARKQLRGIKDRAEALAPSWGMDQ
ncbi:MAG: hypothetical protein GXX83_01410 [Gaiellales bacterium]|nr:hypothetical protein [Gaiellales bacterium]